MDRFLRPRILTWKFHQLRFPLILAAMNRKTLLLLRWIALLIQIGDKIQMKTRWRIHREFYMHLSPKYLRRKSFALSRSQVLVQNAWRQSRLIKINSIPALNPKITIILLSSLISPNQELMQKQTRNNTLVTQMVKLKTSGSKINPIRYRWMSEEK